MDIILRNCPYRYELENLCRLFFFTEGVRVVDEIRDPERYVCASMTEQNGGTLCRIELYMDGLTRRAEQWVPAGGDCEYALSILLYRLLTVATPVRPGWGILTGVRPVRNIMKLWDQGYTDRQAVNYMTDRFLTTPEKARLALETARHERDIVSGADYRDCSLYVSIPFCPSRCSYCSFVSQAVEGESRLIGQYLSLLEQEIACVGEKIRKNGLRLKTVYVGGGTPSILSAPQLTELCACIASHCDLSGIEEYTVEAGRPDSTTPEKLLALKEAGVGRVSINPQTLNDRVLQEIGRRHTAQQAIEAFAAARELQFPVINMDLIAGLPGDTLESFRDTLERVTALRPENLTVHTLSLKRSATLQTEKYDREMLYRNPAAEMMQHTLKVTHDRGYEPYYMYRQKNTLGNLENIGFAVDGHYGLYNVYIMEETHTILAVGAGGSTKLVDTARNRIRRVFDYKYASEYISGFEEMLRRKDEIDVFYSE